MCKFPHISAACPESVLSPLLIFCPTNLRTRRVIWHPFAWYLWHFWTKKGCPEILPFLSKHTNRTSISLKTVFWESLGPSLKGARCMVLRLAVFSVLPCRHQRLGFASPRRTMVLPGRRAALPSRQDGVQPRRLGFASPLHVSNVHARKMLVASCHACVAFWL